MSIETRALGKYTTILMGEKNGKYPHGSLLLVEGPEGSLLIDQSLTLIGAGELPRVDQVVHSHCHEDHVAGNHLFQDAPWYFHELNAPGIASLDAMMAIYGFAPGYPEVDTFLRKTIVDEFHYYPRDDACTYTDRDGAWVAG